MGAALKYDLATAEDIRQAEERAEFLASLRTGRGTRVAERHRRVHAGRRRLRGPKRDDDAALIQFAKGTFTRSTVGWSYPDPDEQLSNAINILRVNSNPDGAGPLTLFEGARTNVMGRSAQFGNPLWVKTGVTVGTNVGTAPDGTATADSLTYTATATDQIAQPFVGATTDNHNAIMSIWLRTTSGTKNLRFRIIRKDATVLDVAITVTTTWQRFLSSNTTVGAGASAPQFVLLNDAAATAGTVHAWGGQAEVDASVIHASSYMETTGDGSATRGSDVLTYATGAYPARMGTQPWKFVWSPQAPHDEMNNSRVFFGFSGTNEALRLMNNDRIRVSVGGAAHIESDALTWARHARILVTVNPPAGTLTVLGCLTGDGTFTGGGPWTWPTTGTLRVGGQFSGASEIFSRLGEPYAA